MDECKRSSRLFGGCKFSPRFDLSAATAWPKDFIGSEACLESLVEKSRRSTYVRDVCERCGRTVERGQ